MTWLRSHCEECQSGLGNMKTRRGGAKARKAVGERGVRGRIREKERNPRARVAIESQNHTFQLIVRCGRG